MHRLILVLIVKEFFTVGDEFNKKIPLNINITIMYLYSENIFFANEYEPRVRLIS